MNEIDVELLVAGLHPEPHRLLGAHPAGSGVVVRAYRPDADMVVLLLEGGNPVELELVHPDGLFELKLPRRKLPLRYRLQAAYPDGVVDLFDDPYAFLPTLGELDLHLIAYAKQAAGETVIVCVNLDPHAAHEGVAVVPSQLGLPPTFRVRDALDDATYTWTTGRNYLRLDPAVRQAHVFRVEEVAS